MYRLPNGRKVCAPWEYGWCQDCQSVTAIQTGLSPVALQKKREALRATLPRQGLLSWLGRFARRDDEEGWTRSQLAETESLLAMLAGRESLPKCIDCGSTSVEESLPSVHPGCGGQWVFSETDVRLQRNDAEKVLIPTFEKGG